MNSLIQNTHHNGLISSQYSAAELAEYVENRFYQRVTKIKVKITWESLLYIRKFVKNSLSTGIYDETEDQNGRLTNRAIVELMLEVMQKLNRKLSRPKKEVNLTFTIPQAWAFSEIYGSISAEKLDNYTFCVINPIINEFYRAIL